jgi:K+-transporting ATPase KdpF subunit
MRQVEVRLVMENVVMVGICCLLMIYLVYALLRPEKF